MKHVVYTVIFSGLFVCRKVSSILHYHDRLVVTITIAADRTQFLISQSKAFFAISDIRSRAGHRTRKLFYLILGHIDDVKRQALG